MFQRPVGKGTIDNERLVEATFRGDAPDQQRHDDEVSRARFDDALAANRRRSLIERIRGWARRRP